MRSSIIVTDAAYPLSIEETQRHEVVVGQPLVRTAILKTHKYNNLGSTATASICDDNDSRGGNYMVKNDMVVIGVAALFTILSKKKS